MFPRHITLVKVAKFGGHSLNSTEVVNFLAKGKVVAQKTPPRSELGLTVSRD